MYQNYMNLQAPMTMSGQFPNQYSSIMRQEIVKVHGENGAKTYQMAANSSALLLDDTDPIVWLVQTDGAGYKTISPFSIKPFQTTPPVDVNSLEERIARLEARLNESDIVANERSDKPSANNAVVEQPKRAKQSSASN